MGNVLETRNLTKNFGGLTAVDHVDIEVPEGGIIAIIGPNGAGKTTIFNCLTGFYESDGGEVWFKGQSLLRLSPDKITSKGISRTYQNIRRHCLNRLFRQEPNIVLLSCSLYLFRNPRM